MTGWADPGTPARGLATTSNRWLDTTNTWLATHAQYDQVGNVRAAWDALGNQSQVSYTDSFSDSVNRNTYAFPTATTSAVPDLTGNRASNTALTAAMVYDFSTGHVTASTDANGQVTTADYSNDPLDRLKQVNRPDGGRTTYTYVDVHQCGPYVETRTLLDAAGRELDAFQFFDGLGRGVRSFQYEGQDANNPYLTADTQYDALGRAWRGSNPYRSAGCTSAVNPAGNWTTSVYDALGRVTTVTTPDGAQVTTAYSGNTVTVTDQAGKGRKSVTDALGRLTAVYEDPAGLNYQTSYAYDVLGNLRQGTQGTQQRYFLYDSLARLLRARNPEQAVNTALNTAADPISGNTAWSMSYAYDANGNLTAKTDARNVTTTYLYDNLNRVKQTNYSDGTPYTLLTYDFATNGRGRFYANYESSTTGTINYVTAYDALGQPTARQTQFYVTGTGWVTGYNSSRQYDKAGHVTQESYPSGHTVNYNYDAAGRGGDNGASLAFTGNLGDGVTRTYSQGISYAASGGMQEERFGTTTPLYHKLRYNVRGQLYDIRLSTVGWQTEPLNWNRGCLAAYYDSGYHWGGNGGQDSGPDNNGNVLRTQHWVPGDDQASTYSLSDDYFSYDPLNRITAGSEYYEGTGQARTQKFVQAYDYDRWGNRTINTTATWGTGINNLPFTVDAATNRLLPGGAGTLAYDAAGNQSYDNYSSGTAAVSRIFDAENRQTETRTASNQTVSKYTYDAGGQRMRREQNGVVTWQVYGFDGELVAEYAASAAPSVPQKEYGYRGGELLVTAEPGATLHWLVNDQLGTPRMVADLSGSLSGVGRHDYLPFGEEVGAGVGGRTTAQGYVGDNVSQKFTGKIRDGETGLDYFGARYYSSPQGRFTSPDPLLTSGSIYDPQTWNRYTYTLNNPLKFTDPLGLYVFNAALGGDQTDADLRAGATTKKRRKEVDKIITQRDKIRSALDRARTAATDPSLTAAQQAQAQRAVNSYGGFKDGTHDNVVVGLVKGSNRGASTDGNNSDGNIYVNLNFDNKSRDPGVTIAHEGSHVADFQDWLAHRGMADEATYDITQYETETRAFFVSSYIAQGLGLKSYYPEANPDYEQVWNKGWTASQREVYRAYGVSEWIFHRYENTSTRNPLGFFDQGFKLSTSP